MTGLVSDPSGTTLNSFHQGYTSPRRVRKFSQCLQPGLPAPDDDDNDNVVS